jgi:adenosylmethionine-8-amino-7-oxononanoate aminotransferase
MPHPVAISKQGSRIRRLENGAEKETLVIGGACSEVFSGPRLAKLLRPGLEVQTLAVERLARGEAAPVLSVHTSVAVPSALHELIEAFEPHLPWSEGGNDWFMSFQVEGASAVWAACDLGMQLNSPERRKVAVASSSYHGPGSSSYGSRKPFGPKSDQVVYPAPTIFNRLAGEDQARFEARMLAEFVGWLDEHGKDISVLLCEPQWGSSVAAQPWSPSLLRDYIKVAQERGIFVVADEIMCGLGRHCQEDEAGNGTLFLSKAWGLNPDAVTFGKAVGGGMFPLSGVIVRRGAGELGQGNRSVMQSHTYAGSSLPAILTAKEVLQEVMVWHEHSAKIGEVLSSGLVDIAAGCNRRFNARNCAQEEDKTVLVCHGQGLMQGGLFTFDDPQQQKEAIALFKRACAEQGVLPYFVPVGGFMITPLMDIDEGEMREALRRLDMAVTATVQQLAAASE